MSDLITSIQERYQKVLDTISASAFKAGRTPEATRIVVVTKFQPPDVIQAAVEAGARLLGENYAEEAADKIAELKPQTGVEWHMIGHVQSRKALLVARHFSLVHSLDSRKLAQRLNDAAADLGRILPVLIEFNVSGDKNKYGWEASDETLWQGLLSGIMAIASMPSLKIRGLMTMPPLSTDPETARPHFQKLRHLRDYLSKKIPNTEWAELSMGTSADYAVAVEEGATLVRIGQAILGPRYQPEKK